MNTQLIEMYLFQEFLTEGCPVDALQQIPGTATPSLSFSIISCIPFQSASHSVHRNVGSGVRSDEPSVLDI